MSVQNGERLATKQDLADMYQGILPYLGGMPEVLANKFSKGDMYSTDEKMIGQWIDGKPLYQRSVSSNFPNSAGSAVSVVDFTSWNVEAVVDVKIYGQLFTASNFQNETYIGGGSFTMFTRRKPAYPSDTLNINLSNADYKNQPIVITLQYTKTTDSAISIGDDTDYSTEEKIVGTWIDGSSVYQKTITGLNVTPAYNSWTAITSVSSLNIKYLLDVKPVILDTSLPLNAQYSGIEFRISSGSLDAEYLQNISKRVINVITIQYTKTTT